MEGSEPYNFGDFPDDPEDSAADDDALKPPWLPPEDRLWRHPSEVAEYGRPQGHAPTPTMPGRPPRRDRRFAATAGVVGAAAVVAAVVVVSALSMTDSPGASTSPQSVLAASNVTLATAPAISDELVVKMMAALRPSLISISPVSGSGALHMTGIVLTGGDLAVTSAAAVGKAKQVDIVTASGQHRRVRVLGTDPHSGIAVVGTGGGLTAASFSTGAMEPGEVAIAACLCGSAAVATAAAAARPASAAVDEVRKVDTAAKVGGGTGLVDTIEADMPLGPSPLGGALLDGQGQVVGVLDARLTTATGHTGVFVPATLAVAVAQELATVHTVEHGWLGIKCTNVANGGGARITAVMAGSPAAAAGLHQGDVVEEVDLRRIDTLADLQATLYTSPPGTEVSVMLDRSGRDMVTTMTLAGSPTG